MKKSMLVVLVFLSLALFSLSGKALAGPDDLRSFILTNENSMGGEQGLIDLMIAAGHGDDSLYEVLQFLAAQPGSNIPADFVTAVGTGNPPGSDVFHSTLSDWTGLNNPVGINADGSTLLGPFYGRDYFDNARFNYSLFVAPDVGRINFTHAKSSAGYIDTGWSSLYHPGQNYQAIGIAWAPTKVLALTNERGTSGNTGGLVDQLIAAGHGDDTLYQVLLLLAAQPGSNIPPGFVAEIGSLPPGSDVFNPAAALSNFAGLNSPVGIGTDGSLTIHSIFGRDLSHWTGFASHDFGLPGIANARTTLATSPEYYLLDGGELDMGVVWSVSTLCYVLSNETPGHLIDKLVAAGHGSENLYQVLQFLAADPNSGIPAEFVTQLGNAPAGSDVKTEPLTTFSNFENNPICISADGTAFVAGIYGREYDGTPGFVTGNMSAVGVTGARSTRASSPTYYIDAGADGPELGTYRAIGIAWLGASAPAAIPTLNEWGLILLSLVLAGAGLVYVKRRRQDAN